MEPYATQKEKKVGVHKPKIVHLPDGIDDRSKSQRRAEKQNIKDQRRAIKKAARQQLKRDLESSTGYNEVSEIAPMSRESWEGCRPEDFEKLHTEWLKEKEKENNEHNT